MDLFSMNWRYLSNYFQRNSKRAGLFASHFSAMFRRLSAMKALTRPFSAHPRAVGETYTQHLWTALCFSGSLLLAALAALVHGLFPFLFVRTGSTIINRLHGRMTQRQPTAPLRNSGA
jgi:hypothetical protein